MPRIPVISHGLLLQLPTYDNSNPSRWPVFGEPRQLGRLHWLLESGLPHVSTWRPETHRETNPAIRWLKACLKHRTQNMTYTHCPFFWWGGKGATEKRNGRNQTQNRTAFCHHPPVDMDSVFSPTSPNVPPAFCECVTSQGELGGFSCKTTDIMRPSKKWWFFVGLEAWSSTNPTRNHAITA